MKKRKMWCLINKNTGRIIKVWAGDCYVIGFDLEKDLLFGVGELEDDEEVRKIVFSY